MLANRVHSLYPLISKFHEHICHRKLCLFDSTWVSRYLFDYSIISDKVHAEWYTIHTNFDILC